MSNSNSNPIADAQERRRLFEAALAAHRAATEAGDHKAITDALAELAALAEASIEARRAAQGGLPKRVAEVLASGAAEALDALAGDKPDYGALAELAALAGPVFEGTAALAGRPLPEPVLWRAHHDYGDSVAAVGEVAVLAGAGRAGKSFLALQLALAAAHAMRVGNGFGEACGLHVKGGPAAMVSYEDSAVRIAHRAAAIDAAHDVPVLAFPAPLFAHDAKARQWTRAASWPRFWGAVAALEPALVVLDTGPKAMGGETNDGGAVMAFMDAVAEECRRIGAAGLVLAHDTKASRDASASGSQLGAGAVAGSSQWFDSSRGVLHVAKTGPGESNRILECAKASYGRDGWGALLEPWRGDGGEYRGLRMKRALDERELAALRREAKRDAKLGVDGKAGKGADGKAGKGADGGKAAPDFTPEAES